MRKTKTLKQGLKALSKHIHLPVNILKAIVRFRKVFEHQQGFKALFQAHFAFLKVCQTHTPPT